MFVRALSALALLVLASLASAPSAAQEIRTPLQLVPLWSDEMVDYLTGRRQAACSGANPLPSCTRVAVGVCDDTAYFHVGVPTGRPEMPYRPPAKQTESARPQFFRLELTNAGYGSGTRTFGYDAAGFESFELEFNCSVSGNDGCPGNRFQTGAVQRVAVSLQDGTKPFDLTAAATVRPDGPIVVRIDGALKAFLLEDTSRIYQLRAVSECFSVAPSPVEWTIPVYRSQGGTDSTGAVVVRVLAGTMTFAYRRAGGNEVPFEPDWVQPDWGYTFLMEQTFLDRKEEWFLLPARPFESPVWIRLPPRIEPSLVETGVVYTLSKGVTGLPKGERRTVTVPPGNVVVVGRQGALVEMRKEEPFDMPCADGKRGVLRALQTYMVDAAEFYDADRHLQLTPAYPKGC